MNHSPPPGNGAGDRCDLGGVEKFKGATMKATEHTQLMLGWWRQAGVDSADLAVKRLSGKWIWHRDLPLTALPFAWARAENVRGAEVYIRPARIYAWHILFLDDVPINTAVRVARKYDALVIFTSREGGCHVWLRCSQKLDEEARLSAQRWLAARIDADPASVSGEHLGRLAGFKNWKRGGTWVNAIEATHRGRCWLPAPALSCRQNEEDSRVRRPWRQRGRPAPRSYGDQSESGREWGWVCGRLEAGCHPSTVYKELVERASSRRGTDTRRYAARTINRALRRVGGRHRGRERE
jgi:hypothetical protein